MELLLNTHAQKKNHLVLAADTNQDNLELGEKVLMKD